MVGATKSPVVHEFWDYAIKDAKRISIIADRLYPNLNQEKYYNTFYTEDWMKHIIKERYESDFKIFNYGLDI